MTKEMETLKGSMTAKKTGGQSTSTSNLTVPLHSQTISRPITRNISGNISGNISRNISGQKQLPTPETVNNFWYMIPVKGSCTKCGRSFDDPASLEAHDPCFKSSNFYKKDQYQSYTCRYCSAAFATARKLKLHLYNHFPKRFVCKVCNLKRASPRQIASHVMTHADKTNQLVPQFVPQTQTRTYANRTATLNNRSEPDVTATTASTSNSTTIVRYSAPPHVLQGIQNPQVNGISREPDINAQALAIGIRMHGCGTFIPPTQSILDFIQV